MGNRHTGAEEAHRLALASYQSALLDHRLGRCEWADLGAARKTLDQAIAGMTWHKTEEPECEECADHSHPLLSLFLRAQEGVDRG